MNLFSIYLVNDSKWPMPRIACSLWLDLDFIVCLASQYTVCCLSAAPHLTAGPLPGRTLPESRTYCVVHS